MGVHKSWALAIICCEQQMTCTAPEPTSSSVCPTSSNSGTAVSDQRMCPSPAQQLQFQSTEVHIMQQPSNYGWAMKHTCISTFVLAGDSFRRLNPQ